MPITITLSDDDAKTIMCQLRIMCGTANQLARDAEKDLIIATHLDRSPAKRLESMAEDVTYLKECAEDNERLRAAIVAQIADDSITSFAGHVVIPPVNAETSDEAELATIRRLNVEGRRVAADILSIVNAERDIKRQNEMDRALMTSIEMARTVHRREVNVTYSGVLSLRDTLDSLVHFISYGVWCGGYYCESNECKRENSSNS